MIDMTGEMMVLAQNLTSWIEALPWIGSGFLARLLASILIFVIGYTLVRVMSQSARRFANRKFSAQGGMVAQRLVSALGYFIVLIMILNQFNVKLGALLGAAGVGAIAIGFAAQTSLSNIISGIFLIGENHFSVGDTIEVNGISGKVDTIGLLSLTMRMSDNRSVRIPNESLVKGVVINISRHPIRRYDLQILVAYHEDIDRVLAVLRDVADKNLFCLDEPMAGISFQGFGDSSLRFQIEAWATQEDYSALRNSLSREIKMRFDQEQIEIPSTNMTLVDGTTKRD